MQIKIRKNTGQRCQNNRVREKKSLLLLRVGIERGKEMRRNKPRTAVLVTLLIAVLIAGCATSAYKDVFKDENSPNVKTFNVLPDDCYIAGKRAVLSQNFRIEREDLQARSFTAARYFEDGKDSIVVIINANVMAAGKDRSTVYASATQHVEKVRVKTDRAFLGLVPAGSEATKVKQEERTIEDKDFYKKLFAALEKELRIVRTGR